MFLKYKMRYNGILEGFQNQCSTTLTLTIFMTCWAEQLLMTEIPKPTKENPTKPHANKSNKIPKPKQKQNHPLQKTKANTQGTNIALYWDTLLRCQNDSCCSYSFSLHTSQDWHTVSSTSLHGTSSQSVSGLKLITTALSFLSLSEKTRLSHWPTCRDKDIQCSCLVVRTSTSCTAFTELLFRNFPNKHTHIPSFHLPSKETLSFTLWLRL